MELKKQLYPTSFVGTTFRQYSPYVTSLGATVTARHDREQFFDTTISLPPFLQNVRDARAQVTSPYRSVNITTSLLNFKEKIQLHEPGRNFLAVNDGRGCDMTYKIFHVPPEHTGAHVAYNKIKLRLMGHAKINKFLSQCH